MPWPGLVVLPITAPPLFLPQSLLQGEQTSRQSCVQLLVVARFFLWLYHPLAFSFYWRDVPWELLMSWVSALNSLLAKGGILSLFPISFFCLRQLPRWVATEKWVKVDPLSFLPTQNAL